MGIIKAMSRWPGFEYARRSPSVEPIYRQPGLLRRDRLVLFLLQFTDSQLWSPALSSPPHTSCIILKLVLQRLTSSSRVVFITLCPSLSVFFFSSRNQREFLASSQNWCFTHEIVSLTTAEISDGPLAHFGRVKWLFSKLLLRSSS